MTSPTPRRTPRTPRHPLLRTAGLAIASLAAAVILAWSPQAATGWNRSSAEATLWQLLNGARVNNGVRPLQQHSTLVSLARWRSKDMIDRNYFDHVVLGSGYQVYHWYDLNGLQYSWGGENIGWNNGYTDEDSPVAIHEGFMNSPGHRANVLEPGFTHGGVGAHAADDVNFLGKLRSPRVYTELFMAAAPASTPPPPPPPAAPTPPPPPSDGGSPANTLRPNDAPAALRVDPPRPPVLDPSREAPGLEAGDGDSDPAALARALGRSEPGESVRNGVQAASATLRVRPAAAPDQGIFEAVFGTLLGFFLG